MAIPSSLTDEYGPLLTSTARNLQPRIANNITKSNKYTAFMNAKGRIKLEDGGERVQVALMHAQNTTADIIDGYDQIDTTPQGGFTSVFYEWRQLVVSVSISRKEERQNSGKQKLLDLFEMKMDQAEASGAELLNNCLVSGRITSGASSDLGQFDARVGKLNSSAKGPDPIPALIDANPSRSVSIGNINGNTFSFWRNNATDSSATTFAGYKQELNNMYNNCSKGTGGNPDLLLSDQVAWEQYFNSLQSQERFATTDQTIFDVLKGAGGETLKFRGAFWVWDEVVPDVKTNADLVDNVGTVSLSTVHFMNSNAMQIIVDRDSNWNMSPMVQPENQRARTGNMIWMGANTCNNRRKLGVLMGISQSIVA